MRARLCACACQHSKSVESQLSPEKILILNDSWWFWTILKTYEIIMNFWKTTMSFLCIWLRFGWRCHFWETTPKNLNLQISIFSKIASFNPNLIIFLSMKTPSLNFHFKKLLVFFWNFSCTGAPSARWSYS